MEKPFKLNQGIYFENSKQMLRWGESLDELKNIDKPQISNNGDIYTWVGKFCLGNQKLNVIVYRNQYHNNNGKLEFVHFEEENETQSSLKLTADKYSNYFKKHLGNPTSSKTSFGRLTELWNVDDLQIIIGVGERFTDFLIFGVHKGLKFWNLEK